MKVKITDIIIGKDRGRTDFGDILELSESIKKYGLLHPLVVRPMGAFGYDHDKEEPIVYKKTYLLIAGERRLRACIFAGMLEVNVTFKEDVDAVTGKEMELEENLRRKDLTWPETCELTAQLDELKRKQHGSATRSHDSAGWGVKETAHAVNRSVGAVSEDIKLAQAIRANPKLLKKVGHLPKHAARRIIKQDAEAAILRKKVEDKELIIDATLLLGSCEELIDDVADESVHLWLTDPPFGIQDILDVGKTGNKSMTYSITKSNVETPDVMRACYKKLIPKVFKKLVPGAHIYIFHAPGWYCELLQMLGGYGFDVGEVPIIWDKMRTSIVGKCLHYTASHECIFFGRKPPNSRLLKKPLRDVFPIQAINPQDKAHSLQKPDTLIRAFIENSTNVGEMVLDTFAGSAQTLVTARKLQRRAIGFEKDNDNFLRAQAFMQKELRNKS